MSEPQVSGVGGSRPGRAAVAGGGRADRQTRAAVATVQIFVGVLLLGAVAGGPVGVLVLVVGVQAVWVGVAGRVLGLTFSGRTLIAVSALVGTAVTLWQVTDVRSGRLVVAGGSGRLGVLAPVLGLVVVAAVFVQLARRDGRTDLTVRLAGTVLVAVLGVLPAALLAAVTSGAGRAGLVVLACAVLAAGAATGLGAGALGAGGLGAGGLGAGGLGSGVAGPGERRVSGRRSSVVDRVRRAGQVAGASRSRTAALGGALAAASVGVVAAVAARHSATGIGRSGHAVVSGAAVYVALGLLSYLTALAAATVARATPSTRSGGLVAASLAVALATPLVLVATRLVR